MLLRQVFVPFCCSNREKSGAQKQTENVLRTLVRAQSRLYHAREAEGHTAPCANRWLELPCSLTKSEGFDILHTSDSKLKEWWNSWLLLLFLRLFRCCSNCLCWIFNHLAITDPNLLMFWQLSFISHPFITQGVRQTRESVGKKVSQHTLRAHRNAEWKRRKKYANKPVWLLAANMRARVKTARSNLNWMRECGRTVAG